jgi:hypothetical protein
MIVEAFTDAFSPKFKSFLSRMYVDYMDETKSIHSITEDEATYIVNNFKYLVRRFNTQNGNEHLNIK